MNLSDLENTIRAKIQAGLQEITLAVPIGSRSFQISGKMEPGESTLTLTGSFDTGNPPGMADLVNFFDLDAFVQSFPEPLRALRNIQLDELKFGFERDPTCLDSIDLLVNLPEFAGFSSALQITGGTLETIVEHPLDRGARQVRGVIQGRLLAGEKALETQLDLPEGKFSAALAEGEEIDLTDMLYPLLDAVGIARPQGFPTIHIQKVVVEGDWKAKSLSFSAESQDTWKTELAGKELVFGIEQVQFTYAAEEEAKFEGEISGGASFAGTTVEASAKLGEEAEIEVKSSDLNLTAILEELMPGVDLPEELPDLAFTQVELKFTPKSGVFSLKAASDGPWAIPVGVQEPYFHDLLLELKREEGEDGKVTGALEGALAIGSTDFATKFTLPGDFELKGKIPSIRFSPLMQELCGTAAVQGLGVPVDLLDVELQYLAFTIAPQAKTFSFSGGSGLGKTELIVKRIEGAWAFIAGFQPPAAWKLSDLIGDLNTLDDLSFSNTALVVSTAKDSDLQLETIALPQSDLAVVKGLNFLASLDTTGLGIDRLLGLHSLEVYAAIGSRPSDMELTATIGGEVALGGGAVFTGLKLRLKPSPFSLSLLGTVIATLDDSRLMFVGGMEIDLTSASFKGTMSGVWEKPFGVETLVVSDLALELGISWATMLPKFAFAGGLKVGNFTGALAVQFDSAQPSQSMLAVAFNKLYLMDILRTFLSREIVSAIPEAVQSSVLNIGMEDLKVYIVPQDTQIGELKFEQGFAVQAGKVVFWGLSGAIDIKGRVETGLKANGHIDPIVLAGGVFKLTGAAGDTAPASFALEVAPGKIPVIDVSARVVLLGASAETIVKLSEEGFYFLANLNLFNLFRCRLEAWGRDLNQGGDFLVRASMENDLLEYLSNKATEAIQAGTSAAVASLTEAQNAITGAQLEVARLDDTIAEMRRTVEAEREKTRAALRSEVQKVAEAQREVDSLNGAIQAAHNEINATQREIDAKNRWYAGLPWYRKAYEWVWLGPYLGGLYAKISGLYASIGSLEAAKWTANGVLELYKQTVKALESKVLNWVPIEMDPRLAALYTARYTAWAALEAAKQVLEALKASLGFMGGAAIYIIDYGLTGILNVQEVTFEAALSAASGGNVFLAVRLAFMGQQREMSFYFNFNNPLESAKSLGQLLLEG